MILVVYEDEHLLVVDKPAHLPTTSPDGSDCLVSRVEAQVHGAERLHPTSRLDAEVTGLVTFAKTKRATEMLLEARKRGAYRRLYIAIALKDPGQGVWRDAIGSDPADPRTRRVVASDAPGAKLAETRFESVPVEHGALLRLFPRTGRTHQLRVHAAHAGCALFGDIHYGGERRFVREDGRVVRAPRVLLHCAALRIPSVSSGELSLASAPPEDFAKAYGQLGGTELAERVRLA